MDENAKRRAIQAMLAYIEEVDIPCPDNIYTWGNKVSSYLNKAAPYYWDRGDGVTEEEFKARQLKEAREWITDIAQIVAHSKSDQRVKITKDYSSMFELTIEAPSWQLNYRVDRAAVCDRVVTGKKVVPRHVEPERIVEEHTEDIVEWVCNDVALLTDDDGNERDEGKEVS